MAGAEGGGDRTERVRLPQMHWAWSIKWSGSAFCSVQRRLGAELIVMEAWDSVEGDNVPFAAKYDVFPMRRYISSVPCGLANRHFHQV